MLVVWCVEIFGFYFSDGLRILTRKPGVREETDASKLQKLPDVMRSFFDGFATIYSLSMTSCAIFSGGSQLSSCQRGCICLGYKKLSRTRGRGDAQKMCTIVLFMTKKKYGGLPLTRPEKLAL